MKTQTSQAELLDRAELAGYQPAIPIIEPLSEADFLESLDKLKLSQSLAELRTEIVWLDSRLRQLPPSISLFNLSPAYLLNELAQIRETLTLERAGYYVERLEKGLLEIKTAPLNDINLNRWKAYDDIQTDSLWLINRRDSTGVHSAGYWGNFVPQIPQQMIKRYTKKGELVLDTFVGSGTTLIESQRLGRHGIGIELQSEVAETARTLIANEKNLHQVKAEIVTGNALTTDYKGLLLEHGFKSAQLVIMHPPYFDIIKFSDNPADLSNAASIEAFVEQMGQAVENVSSVLDKGRYLVIVIGDKYAKGQWIPLGFQTMNEVLKSGFSLKSIVVKNFEETSGKRNQKELWRYRALAGGFFVFKHEYIFIFQKG